ncbi:hypothetical protein ACWPKO_00385 [Coraliomargarita sp. W4R53]
MRPTFTLLMIVLAGLCFTAGYKVGVRHGSQPASATPIQIEAEQVAEPITATPPPPAEISPMPSPVIQAEPVKADAFTQRAQQHLITLTDKQERALVGELLGTSEQHLKLRRKSDSLIVEVPIAMLCENDQAFAAYLLTIEKSSQQSPPRSEADRVLDELFKNM